MRQRRYACAAGVPVLAALLLMVAGCTEDPASDEVARWSSQLIARIGVVEGDSPYEFHRIAGAERLSDGRIVVADGGSLQVRIFTADGVHESSFGRRGNGPGEFDFLGRLRVEAGDTIVAGNWLRLARFLPDGTLLDEYRPSWTGIDRAGYSVDGAWPLTRGAYLVMLLRNSRDITGRGLFRPGKVYVIADHEGAMVDTIGEFPALEQISHDVGGRDASAVQLFPADTRVAMAGHWITFGDMAADSVLVYDVASRDRRWVRLPLEPREVSPDELQSRRDDACAWATDEETRADCEFGVSHLPEQTHYPLFDGLSIDSTGQVWVRPQAPAEDGMDEWLVLEPAGSVVASLGLPADLQITRIGGDYVLGTMRDAFGVETVQLHRVQR